MRQIPSLGTSAGSAVARRPAYAQLATVGRGKRRAILVYRTKEIGEGLALAEGLDPKHAIKQVDRLLSKPAISVDTFFRRWVLFVVTERKALRVALDSTEFDRVRPRRPDHDCPLLLTNHGRATPLIWKTVRKSELKERQGEYEDAVIEQLHALLDPSVRVTPLADRGFGGQARYEHLDRLRRTHSLFRQGSFWYAAIPTLREERLVPLMEAFGKIVANHEVSRDFLGVI